MKIGPLCRSKSIKHGIYWWWVSRHLDWNSPRYE